MHRIRRRIKGLLQARFLLVASWMVPGPGSFGCASAVNPWRDSRVARPPVTTPSADAVRSHDSAGRAFDRGLGCFTLALRDDGVTHLPLYFEDPSEEPPTGEGPMCWRGPDYGYLVLAPCRFAINGLLAPVWMFVSPPWAEMVSDGRPAPRFALGPCDPRRGGGVLVDLE